MIKKRAVSDLVKVLVVSNGIKERTVSDMFKRWGSK